MVFMRTAQGSVGAPLSWAAMFGLISSRSMLAGSSSLLARTGLRAFASGTVVLSSGKGYGFIAPQGAAEDDKEKNIYYQVVQPTFILFGELPIPSDHFISSKSRCHRLCVFVLHAAV